MHYLSIVAVCCGIIAASLLPHHDFSYFYPLLMAILLLIFSKTRLVGYVVLGVGWGVFQGLNLVSQQLHPDLEGETFFVTGYLADIPQDRGRYYRFPLEVTAVAPQNSHFPDRLLLNWYNAPTLRAGEQWQLQVKLKRPRGSVNEGGFDYQRWLLSEGIGATGYVRDSNSNQKMEGPGSAVQRLRDDLFEWVRQRDDVTGNEAGRLAIALLIGDTHLLSDRDWQILSLTGTNHLLAISGLHIGLVAMFGFFIGRALRGLASVSGFQIATHLPSIVSICFAFFYALLAGFGLPTQRALVMVCLVHVGLILFRRISVWQIYCWALLAVLLIDPLAHFDRGFWLSFGAVFVLLFTFSNRIKTQKVTWKEKSKLVWLPQLVIFIGLCLPLGIQGQPISFASPVINALAIPFISFITVPLLLVAATLYLLNIAMADVVLQWGCDSLYGFWRVIEQAAATVDKTNSLTLALSMDQLSVMSVLFVIIGLLWLLAPKGWPLRWISIVLLLPIFAVADKENKFSLKVTALDVGQGLAVVVQTDGKTLLYDTGPWSGDRFNAGEAIVLPYLRSQGIKKINTMVVSHADSDHSGGVSAILKKMPVDELVLGEALPFLSSRKKPFSKNNDGTVQLFGNNIRLRYCDESSQWVWGDVKLQLIEPNTTGLSVASIVGSASESENNNASCILQITFRDQTILLPGDIEASVENHLIRNRQLSEPVTILFSPHHGSRTSSTAAFVETVQPRYVVHSAGYRNRYFHPHHTVVDRYQSVGAKQFHIGLTGQMDFVWGNSGALHIQRQRQDAKRYWYAQPQCEPDDSTSASGDLKPSDCLW